MERPMIVPTSTVYMSGEALYSVQRPFAPGIIVQVVLTADKYEDFKEAVRALQENAWDKGYMDGETAGGKDVPDNPYRTKDV